MFSDLRNSVVRVLNSSGRTAGTAFFCIPKGLLVTCTHVIDALANKNDVTLEFFPANALSPVRLTAVACAEWETLSSREDITVLRLNSPFPAEARSLYFDTSRPRVGSIVDSFGYSANNPEFGLPGTATFVGLTRITDSCLETFVLDSEMIARGYSGGPCVLRETGEVLGVVGAITTPDLENRWGKGVFVIPAATVLDICPLIAVGVPEIVHALVNTWVEHEEPFQKYVLVSKTDGAEEDSFELPTFELATQQGIQIVAFQDAIAHEQRSISPRVICVAGAPGTGKSRLLSTIARAAWTSPVALGLDEQLVPFLVTAQSLVQSSGTSFSERLTDALKKDGAVFSQKPIDAKTVDELLVGGRFRCAILVDAVDEIASPLERKAFFKILGVHAPTLLGAGHLVILTSRPLDELQSDRLNKISCTYLLPLLSKAAAQQLVVKVLGDLHGQFRAVVESTGLAPLLDTPLLLKLAAALFIKKRSGFPKDILGLYSGFLATLLDGWTEAPVGHDQIVDVLSNVALASITVENTIDSFSPWLTEIDKVLQSAFASLAKDTDNDKELRNTLRTAQAIVNFAVSHSGLLFRSGENVQWGHLLLRDYLIAKQLARHAKRDMTGVVQLARDRYVNPLWREALILFVVTMSRFGQAEEILYGLSEVGDKFPVAHTLFIKDCIQRGAVLNKKFLDEYFMIFEEHALNEQDEFGSCAKVYSDDYGMFWHLLTLQRIPEAGAAIARAVSKARAATIMAEWPHSERAKIFTPSSVYGGPLAINEPVYVRT